MKGIDENTVKAWSQRTGRAVKGLPLDAIKRAGIDRVAEEIAEQRQLIKQKAVRKQNTNEKNFAADVLYWQKLRSQIADYTHEHDALPIGNGVKYLPDFLVTPVTECQCSCGVRFPHRIYYELKGEKRTRKGKCKVEARQAAVVKIKVAAARYPEYKFILAWKVDDEWQYQEVLP